VRDRSFRLNAPQEPLSTRIFVLLEDGHLAVETATDLVEAVAPWLPRNAVETRSVPDGRGTACIQVVRSGAHPPPPTRSPDFQLFTTDLWMESADSHAELRGNIAGSHGVLGLRQGSARIGVPRGASGEGAAADLYLMLTVTAALLLNRQGRALVHGAAVVDPDGRAWLLVGDSHSGKSTTCANLMRGGWGYLADDQVVLSPGAGGDLRVDGWPRAFQVDAAWHDGRSAGARVRIDPDTIRPGALRRSARLAGLLFPMVIPDAPTELLAHSAVEAFSGLLRQSPWIMQDEHGARASLDLLRRAASLPRYQLKVGLDTYTAPEVLVQRLSALRAR
jgi:hypothetical protein